MRRLGLLKVDLKIFLLTWLFRNHNLKTTQRKHSAQTQVQTAALMGKEE